MLVTQQNIAVRVYLLHRSQLTGPMDSFNPYHPVRAEELCRRPRSVHHIHIHDSSLKEPSIRYAPRLHPQCSAAVGTKVVDSSIAGSCVGLDEGLEHVVTRVQAKCVVWDRQVGAEHTSTILFTTIAVAHKVQRR